MKALVKMGDGLEGVCVKDIEEPQPGKDEIKIKVHATGICGTDIHIINDEYPCKRPVVLGHEFSGIVHEVGSNVTKFKPGDRVVSLTAVVTCGNCKYCHEGLLMLCEKRLSIGSGVNGAFAEYLVVPENTTFMIPENVTLDDAALCEPLACVVRAVIEMSTVKPGDYVYISGPGPIGLLTLQVAASSGAKVLAVAGTNADKERLEMALKLGASDIINVNEGNVYECVKEITEGNGFDAAFECAGVAASADVCLNVLKKTGIYSQVALFGKKIELDVDRILTKEIRVTSSYASERTSWETALRLLRDKQINTAPLISDKMRLTDWKEAVNKITNKQGYKILLMPNDQ